MGQDRKIKEIARGYEFRISTRASQEEIVRILDAAASAARQSSQQGTILRTSLRTTQNGFASSWEIKGLGRLVTILAFVVNGRRDASGVSSIEMRLVGDFFYQKGSILGPPTLNGSKVLGRFRELVIAGLRAAPAATTQPLATPQVSTATPPPRWRCHSCGILNDADRDSCRDCDSTRPQGAPAVNAAQPAAPPPRWRCRSCGILNDDDREQCRDCGGARPTSTPPGA